MTSKLKPFYLTKRKLLKGDVIGVDRNSGLVPYIHYGIYAGNNQVIHYFVKHHSKFSGDIEASILKTDIDDFLGNSSKIFILDFDSFNKYVSKDALLIEKIFGLKQYKIFSANETLKRAHSRIGESKYSLVTNNCEHFALYCKTGLNDCNQLIELLSVTNYRIYVSYTNPESLDAVIFGI